MSTSPRRPDHRNGNSFLCSQNYPTGPTPRSISNSAVESWVQVRIFFTACADAPASSLRTGRSPPVKGGEKLGHGAEQKCTTQA